MTLVDLRGASAEAAMDRVGAAVQALGHAGDGSRRLLLLDDTTLLKAHHDVLGAVLAPHGVGSMVWLAVGTPAGLEWRQAVQAMPLLGVGPAAVLWVGDEWGVAWGMGAHDGVRPPDAVPAGGASTLARLVAVLLVPEVFDQVVAGAADLPNRVASPGLRVVASQPDLPVLLAGHDQAVAVVAGRDAGGPTVERGGPSLGSCELLVGGDRTPPGYGGPLRADSPLGRLHAQATHCCREADRLVRRMAGLVGLWRPTRSGRAVRAAVTMAGQSLGAYQDALVDALELGDGPGGLDRSRRDELERMGVSWQPVPGLDRASVITRLQTAVEGAVGSYPLRALATWLQLVSDRATPQGSAAHLRRLDRLDPTVFIGTLSSPPPFPLPAAPPATLAALAVGCLLASAAPGVRGIATGGALAALWLLTVAVAYHRAAAHGGGQSWPAAHGGGRSWPAGHGGDQSWRAGQRGDRSWRAVLRPGLLAHLGTALVGLVAGQAIGATLPAAVPVHATVAGVAAALLAYALSGWWSGAVRQWRGQLELDRAARRATAQDAILREAALREWVLADQRSFLASAARVMAGALRNAADGMHGYRQQGASSWEPAGVRPPPDRGPLGGLQALLDEDVADAARAALAPCWGLLRSGALDRVGAGVAEAAQRLMELHRQHLAQEGIDQPPPFARQRSGRRVPGSAGAWGPPGDLAEVVGARYDGPLVQLCTTGDLQLLEPPGRVPVVRFAPRSTRDLVLGHPQPGVEPPDVVWTGSGRLAGVIRLVALRAEAVG
ncbi:MAG TPA: hypothetical protein VFB84_14210 [Micromonosporaceae bacterium]|nr:hypothetical protein [Micromonosporaceae bacterium]